MTFPNSNSYRKSVELQSRRPDLWSYISISTFSFPGTDMAVETNGVVEVMVVVVMLMVELEVRGGGFGGRRGGGCVC